ncbi:HTH-type transcriptional repressor CsiR [compost metagenome]
MNLTDQIRADIFSGKFAAGAVLSQVELAAMYGVSRIPVRDALQMLAGEKIVEVLPGKSARVVTLTRQGLDEIYELRLMLECDLLERAIARADAASDAEVDYALRKSSLEAGRPGWQAGDWLFHKTLYARAERHRQLAIVEELRTSCILYASDYQSLAHETERWLADHEALVKAYVARRTQDASDILRQHILAAQAQLGQGAG